MNKKHFVSWCDRFLVPETSLGCTSLEIYSARCGILHSLSPESSLTKSGKARQLIYTRGTADSSRLRTEVEWLHPGEYVVVSLEQLLDATRAAWKQFLQEILKDEGLFDLAYEKAGRMYSSVPDGTPFRSDAEQGG